MFPSLLVLQVIEDSGEVEGNEKQRSERRVAEKELGAGVEEEILVENESLVERRGVGDPNVASLPL